MEADSSSVLLISECFRDDATKSIFERKQTFYFPLNAEVTSGSRVVCLF